MFAAAAPVEAVKRTSSYFSTMESPKRKAFIKYVFPTPPTPLR
jgi:hypothetical protein